MSTARFLMNYTDFAHHALELCWNEGGRTFRHFSLTSFSSFAVTGLIILLVLMPYAESQEVREHKSDTPTLADQYVWRSLVK